MAAARRGVRSRKVRGSIAEPDDAQAFAGHEVRFASLDGAKDAALAAPDIQIKTHPIRFGSGSFTGVTGVMTGTFT